jgi:putative FmdB family regulatory protein
MPIFEYRCAACGHLEELLQKHNDPAPDVCPECGAGQSMAKEISRAAFHLKGGGWYKDLYASSSPDKKDAPAPAAATEKADKPATAEKGDKPAAADKPAAKTDAPKAEPKKTDSKPTASAA